jgi:hypothetical protein
MPDTLLDEIFFGIGGLVGVFVALWPVIVFRAITLGRFDQPGTSSRLIRIVQIVAAIMAASCWVRLVTDLLGQSR